MGVDRADTPQALGQALDPVTFEVLKNALISIVDQMNEQVIRTCYSFVIYARDLSSALFDANGDTVIHGRHDLAGHLGTLHFTAKAVLDEFYGDINEGDMFAINDPYRGGTHFSDVRIVRPIFVDGEFLALAQCNGHWADVGGSAPGSFDVTAREHFGEGLRITPVRICDRGTYRRDVVQMMVSNMRRPADSEGDLYAQAEATRLAEHEIRRLAAKYGRETLLVALREVQNWVERLTRSRILELPDGAWETEDYIDLDPVLGDGLIPIRVAMSISGDELKYDLSGSHASIATLLNTAFGGAHSAIYAGTKIFIPEVPLNAGFYRAVSVELGPKGSVVNAAWPTAVSGFATGPYEKILNSVAELWSHVRPDRAFACSFNIEYLLVGGRDLRSGDDRIFMWYDWLNGGWGGRRGKDGPSAAPPVFGAGQTLQSCEGQERLSPITIEAHEFVIDSAGPGEFRGGCGTTKRASLTQGRDVVISYCCDRARSVTWGMDGGLPSIPHGLWLHQPDGTIEHLGALFSNVTFRPGATLDRPSAGGGGLGDPLARDPARVLEDVRDEYVSPERARLDYGVVLIEDPATGGLIVDGESTSAERDAIRTSRHGWLAEPADEVAARYRLGSETALDLIRKYGVIVDWGSGELLPKTTVQFREMLSRRAAASWT